MIADKIKLAEELVIELLMKLGITPKALRVVEEEAILKVEIDLALNESGILVGFHGEVLSSFQLILSLILYQKTNEWQPLLVDVNQYRQQREATLKRMALAAAQKVKFSNQPMVLPQLSALERRFIHTVLTDNPDVVTQSEGEGWTRRLTVKPKIKKVKANNEVIDSASDSTSAQPAK
ncbi:hypothetical protein KKD62_03545 [Patescibacteria group bacterium]|nr:hypothetical protein [Patescibacteria group bacterium]MBU1931875.1 hypothetical protein [Patescibacteria group bacterium]